MPAVINKQAYSRQEVCRLLSLSDRQLRSWEKQNFIAAGEVFSFSDLIALRTLVSLRRCKVPAAKIRKVVAALRTKLEHGANPLKELKIFLDGGNLQVVFAGRRMEAFSGQLLLDFDEATINRLLSFPKESAAEAAPSRQKKKREAESWFDRGLELERCGAPMEQIIEAYQKASEIDPESAGALVNLGTVYFNARSWKNAEKFYRQALQVQPDYALAHFNLGNLFDEKGDRAKALAHYQAALNIHPSYADAHYNLALVYQGMNQALKAVQHWKQYLKLDPSSPWADIARRELGKLKFSTIVHGAGNRSAE